MIRQGGHILRLNRMRVLAALLVLVPVMGGFTPAHANPPPELLSRIGLPGGRSGQMAEIEALQTELSWIGIHRGQITGRMDADTRESVATFQTGLGAVATGEIIQTQHDILRRRAAAAERTAEFHTDFSDWTGTRLDIPFGFFEDPDVTGDDKQHLAYRGRGVANSILRIERYFQNASAQQWLQVMKTYENKRNGKVLVSGTMGQWSYMVSLHEGRRTYMLYAGDSREVRGIDLGLSEEHAAAMRPVVARILSSFEPMYRAGVSRSGIQARLRSGDHPGASKRPDWYRTMIANGSGSIVSVNGHILTNHHVVAGCSRLTVNGTEATLVGSDVRLDLALVRAPRMANRDPVRFADRAIELGETVFVMGYPVFDISPSLNATSGIVSSAVGFRGDRTRIQITAPIQPGNSGGPVLSVGGAQVAVVAAKASVSAQADKNIENIGWVIRAAEADEFLRRFGVKPIETSDGFDPPREGIADSLRDWRRFTVRVECQSD